MIVALARYTQRDFSARAAESGCVQLLTIPYSHYVDFGRWSLQHSGTPFEEHAYAPGWHVLPTLKVRICGSEKHIAATSSVRRADKGAPTGVPLAVLPDGRVLADSWSIAEAFMGVASCGDEELRETLDKVVGRHSRTLIYRSLLQPQHRDTWNALIGTSLGWWGQTLWSAGVGSRLTDMMRRLFRVEDSAAMDSAERELLDAMGDIGERYLSRGGYINGAPEPCLEDFAMAAMAAPVVLPEEYCCGDYAEYMNRARDADAAMSAGVERFRATAVGRHCLMMYTRHR